MIINRNNYEQYFLDFIEGRLSPALRKELEQFLRANPDLKKELEEFENLSFAESRAIEFSEKFSLKKNFIPVASIDENNYRDFLIGEIENDLSAEEKKNLETFLVKNPFVEREQKIFRNTLLIPDKKIIFPDKRGLKKTVVIRVHWQQAAAAVAIAASILLLLFFNFRKENVSPGVKNEIAEQKKNSWPRKNVLPIDKVAISAGQVNKDNVIAGESPAKEKIIRRKEASRQLAMSSGQPATDSLSSSVHHPDNSENISQKKPGQEEKNFSEDDLAESIAKDNSEEKKSAALFKEEPSLTREKQVREDDSFTLKEFLAFSFKKKVLKEKVDKKKEDAKITPVDLANAAVKGASRLFGSKIKMKKRYSDSGELAAVSISSPRFEISRTLHGK